MVSALAMLAQVSWRLGREPEATDMLINDAGPTEGRKEEVILHDCILVPAVHALLMPRVHNPKEVGKLVSRDHLLQNTLSAKLFVMYLIFIQRYCLQIMLDCMWQNQTRTPVLC